MFTKYAYMTKYHFFSNMFSQRGSQGLQCTALAVSYNRKMEEIVDYDGVFSALLTDLSKVFDSISHDLSITKLETYGFQTDALILVYNYLSNRKQRVNINETFSC